MRDGYVMELLQVCDDGVGTNTGIAFGTRRKYIPVGSSSTSMSQTVPKAIPEFMRRVR